MSDIFASRRSLKTIAGVALLCSGVLVGCSSTTEEEEFAKMSVEDLYSLAKESFDSGSYTRAAQTFAEVERQHPYSEWSLRAQLMSAYAFYEAKKYMEAVEGFNVFVQLHPGHENIPYAYYMMGLCYYEQIPTIERDQEVTEKAQQAFQEVVRRFPDSPYGRDAKYKLDLIKDHLAGKEMEVGRYYLTSRAYLAAVNRFKVVVEKYQTTSHIPEALHRMVECYLALGIPEQAQASAAILGHNFPGSPWYEDTYALMMARKDHGVLPDKKSHTAAPGPVAPDQEPNKTPQIN